MGQPFINPNYFMQPQYQQQMQYNPYMQRMEQLQQYQQNLQQPISPAQMSGTSQQMGVIGKIVDSIDAVKATDVPMDGNMYYFPKADGTEIFSKQWLANGQTRILAFKPVLDSEANNVPCGTENTKFDLSDEATEVFMKRFDAIEKRLDDFIAKSAPKSSSKSKREDDAE